MTDQVVDGPVNGRIVPDREFAFQTRVVQGVEKKGTVGIDVDAATRGDGDAAHGKNSKVAC